MRRPGLWLSAVGFVLAAGCEASFVDQRERRDAFLIPDLDEVDGAVADPGAAGVVASGTFEGRAGHAGAGTAELVREADGRVVLRFGSDFAVSGVPGPVVVLSSRDALGGAIDATKGDLHLGALASSSGGQSYPVPGGDGGRRWAWVYCEPFAVEIARARLEVTP